MAPSQSAIELAVNLITLLDHVIVHLARLGALKVDLMISAKGFDHGIKTLSRPRHQLPKSIDGDPFMTFAEAMIGVVKLLTLGLGLQESSALLLIIEPIAQGFS
jgi:hypothetical protein